MEFAKYEVCMTDAEKVASLIHKDIRAFLKRGEAQTYRLEFCYTYRQVNGVAEEFARVEGHFTYGDGKKDLYIPYTEGFFKALGRNLKALVDADKKIMCVHTDKRMGYSYGDTYVKYEIPDVFRVAQKPCKEWNTLVRLVQKGANFTLDPKECYYAGMFGKRGHLDTETSRAIIPMDKPEWCANAVAWLRKTKTARDTLKVSAYNGESCPDREESAYHEWECSGSRIRSYKFEVFTPTGRNKGSYIVSRNGTFYES